MVAIAIAACVLRSLPVGTILVPTVVMIVPVDDGTIIVATGIPTGLSLPPRVEAVVVVALVGGSVAVRAIEPPPPADRHRHREPGTSAAVGAGAIVPVVAVLVVRVLIG